MPLYANITEAKAANTRKPCAVTGCPNNRHSIGKYCGRHAYAFDTWGHPNARTPRLSEFDGEMKTIRKLLELNADHPGVTFAVSFLDNYLRSAAQGTTYGPAGDRIAALHDAGVTGLELLTRVAAVYLVREGHRKLILGDLHFTALVGHMVLKARNIKGGTRLYGSQRKAVGRYVIDAIGVLCLNLSKTVIQMELERDQQVNAMSRPLILG